MEASGRKLRDGSNTIEINSVPISSMVVEKIIHPFYLFQVGSAIICK